MCRYPAYRPVQSICSNREVGFESHAVPPLY
jgi:hypothetical protein